MNGSGSKYKLVFLSDPLRTYFMLIASILWMEFLLLLTVTRMKQKFSPFLVSVSERKYPNKL